MTFKVNNRAFKSIVNNGSLDPIQGYDVDVWAIDQGTGAYNLVGRFNSIQVLLKNSTENYLEFNQRMPRNLDGEIQIGWIMERGMLDARVLEQTFGVSSIDRSGRINRMPRLQITFSLDARELSEGRVINSSGNNFSGNDQTSNSTSDNYTFGKRQVNHEMVLSFCKVDNLTIAAGAGKQVVANRWEGLAEGIQLVNRQSTNPGLSFETITANNASIISRNNVIPFGDSDSVLRDVVDRINERPPIVTNPPTVNIDPPNFPFDPPTVNPFLYDPPIDPITPPPDPNWQGGSWFGDEEEYEVRSFWNSYRQWWFEQYRYANTPQN